MTRRILLLALAMCAQAPTAASAAPTVSIDDVSHPEGNSATSNATFTVRLSEAAPAGGVSVAYTTSDGSARAPDDYAPAAGAVVIPEGASSTTVGVAVRGDVTDEYDERFNLDVTGASGAGVADGRGVARIIDDDRAPSLSVRDVQLREGSRGVTTAGFVVALSGASGKPVTVHYATSARSARAESDYIASSGALSFAPGVAERNVTVGVIGDTRYEPNESFALKLSGAHNASIRDGTGVARIQDDDAANRPPRVTRYRLAPKVFRAARRGGSLAARPVGTRVSCRLSEPARVVFRVQRLRRSHGRRYVSLRGSFSRAGRSGRSVVLFTGRVRHRRLAPGRYRLVVVAVDSQGLRSRARSVAFRISG